MKHLSESRTQRPALHPAGFFSSFPDRRRGYRFIFALEDENEARRNALIAALQNLRAETAAAMMEPVAEAGPIAATLTQ